MQAQDLAYIQRLTPPPEFDWGRGGSSAFPLHPYFCPTAAYTTENSCH